MRIGIMGDTHGDIHSIRQAVAAVGPVEIWLHTGDFCRDALSLASFAGVPVTSVSGNCDGRTAVKLDEFIEAAGYRIWLTHGHRHGVKQSLDELRNLARQYEADIVVYGHTHQADLVEEPGMMLVNPGSAAIPKRGKNRTCGVLELKPGRNGAAFHLLSLP